VNPLLGALQYVIDVPEPFEEPFERPLVSGQREKLPLARLDVISVGVYLFVEREQRLKRPLGVSAPLRLREKLERLLK